ncbi:helix-turn-helix transcriptional regulator [Enterococcus faecalis]|uniref:helix-turn-helix transcriptional regulator n=1 Tax=Enterococcus faecalis TaxID=1351 RepID=UPI0022E71D99|nr:DNA-binding protein [Enterococcus faecalis]
MSEKLKTIKELADELGVSKQGVRYHMKSIPQEELKKNNKGIVVLNIEQQNFIKRKAKSDTVVSGKSDTVVSGKSDTAVSGKSDTVVSGKSDTAVRYKQEISFLEEKNLLKDNQIDYLKQQIKNYENQANNLIEVQKQTQNLLDQQQRLALQDKKLLEEYKSEINELKALKMPQEDMKDGSSIRGEAQEEIERLKAQLKLSEERNKAKEKEPVKTESKKWWQLWK